MLVVLTVCAYFISALALSYDDTMDYESSNNEHNLLTNAFELEESDYAQMFTFKSPIIAGNKFPIFFTTTAPDDGKYYIAITYGVGRVDYTSGKFTIYDRNGVLSEKKEHITLGEKFLYTREVRKGETISFSMESTETYNPGGIAGTFSVCFNDTHTAGEYSEIIKEASCTAPGILSWPCIFCNESAKTVEIPAPGHVPGEEETILEPTCLREGIKGVLCQVCGEVLSSETLKKAEHMPGEFVVVKSATCLESGINEQHCLVCNAILAKEESTPLGHTAGKWEIAKEASCSEEGQNVQKCSVCELVLKTEAIPVKGHSFDKWQVVKAPTNEEDGTQSRQCQECGYTEYSIINKLQ